MGFILFLFGIVIGSFVNAAIYRLPRGFDMVIPRVSYCDQCHKSLSFIELIPLLSYILQRGRCTNCNAKIGIRSFAIELLNGLFPLVGFYLYGYSLFSILNTWAFLIYLLMVTVIDWDFRIIPDALHLIVLVPLILGLFPNEDPFIVMNLGMRLMGAMFGGGVLLFFAKIYEYFTGNEGMGMGDVKMMFVIGAWFGPWAVLPTLLISSVVGSIIGLAYILARGRSVKLAVPFGPFLSLGALIYFLFSHEIYRVLLGEAFHV